MARNEKLAEEKFEEESTENQAANPQKEIDLLAKLICKTDEGGGGGDEPEEFRFDFLENITHNYADDEKRRSISSGKVICFEQDHHHLGANLQTIIDDLNNLQDNAADQVDLLDLMDS